MADIELSAYIEKVEGLLGQEKNNEAVAHCRHILDFFPKNLATYRMLGKGLLERRRFDDAADIMYRVLSVAPDDFVAHLSLAIIGEEAGDLPQAIGHMERACESQSSNTAIHAELTRLYGRRDGAEPGRIHLSRGALARVYLRGANYAQAVDELRTALQEMPDRIDLEILLAEALWKDEQRIDAVEVCQNILERLPFCLTANSILFQIWRSAGREDEAIIYLERVEMLDPYLAYAIQGPDAGSRPRVVLPQLDYIPPTPEETMGVPEWVGELGLDFEGAPLPKGVEVPVLEQEEDFDLPQTGPLLALDVAEDEPVPDWLRELTPGSEIEPDTIDDLPDRDQEDEPKTVTRDGVPDWLSDTDLLGTGKGAPVMDEAAEAPPKTDELPDWLAQAVEWSSEQGSQEPEIETPVDEDSAIEAKEMPAPPSPVQEIEQPESPVDLAGEIDWPDDEDFAEAAFAGAPKALTAESGHEVPDQQASDFDELPDWAEMVQELSTSEQGTGGPDVDLNDIPDWLQLSEEMPEAEEQPQVDSVEIDAQVTRAEETVMAFSDDIVGAPDGEDFGDVPLDPDDALRWLEQLAAEQGAPVEELPSLQQTEAQPEIPPAEDIPDWLKDIAPKEAMEAPETVGGDEWVADLAAADDELPDWLRAEAKPVEHLPATTPSRGERADNLGDLFGAELTGEEREELAAVGADLTEMPSERDEALAWLDELAEAEGVPEEELPSPTGEVELPEWLTDEAEAAIPSPGAGVDEELPEWLREAAEVAAAPPPPSVEPVAAAEMPDEVDEAMAWLEQLAAEEGAPLEELPSLSGADTIVAQPPSWLPETEIHEAPAPETEEEPEIEEAELPEWLQPVPEDAFKQPAGDGIPDWLRDEELVAELQEPEAEAVPTAVSDEAELPDWLREEVPVVAEAKEAPEPVASVERAELPDWLRDEALFAEEAAEVVEEAPAPVEAVEEVELPAWLREEVAVTDAVEEPAEMVEEVPAPVEAVEEAELPAWLHEEVAVADAVEEPAEMVEEVPAPVEAVEEAELPAWLREEVAVTDAVEEPADMVEEVPAPVEVVEEPELPAWLREELAVTKVMGEPVEVAEEVPAPVEAVEEAELPAWLREEVAVADAVEEPAEMVEEVPAPVEAVEEPELPAWLREELAIAEIMEEPVEMAEEAPAPVEIVEEPELPAWLREEVPVAEVAEEAIEAVEEVPVPIEVVGEPGTRLSRARAALAERDDLRGALGEYETLIGDGQELEEVVKDLEELVESRPDEAAPGRLLGDAHLKLGDLGQALTAYRQALERL